VKVTADVDSTSPSGRAVAIVVCVPRDVLHGRAVEGIFEDLVGLGEFCSMFPFRSSGDAMLFSFGKKTPSSMCIRPD
jgi:hypothetical protein